MRLYVASLLFALITALLIPISVGAQTDAECVAVYDDNGTRVARAAVGSDAPISAMLSVKIFLAHGGLVALLSVTKDALEGHGDLYFTGANCTGDVTCPSFSYQFLC